LIRFRVAGEDHFVALLTENGARSTLSRALAVADGQNLAALGFFLALSEQDDSGFGLVSASTALNEDLIAEMDEAWAWDGLLLKDFEV